MIKRFLKVILKVILSIVVFVIGYLFVSFGLSSITIDEEEKTSCDVSIYIMSNGVHTDIVMPIKNQWHDWSKSVKYNHTKGKDSIFNYVAMGWGDKGFYLETPEWKDLKPSVAFKAAFGLSTTAVHTTFYKTVQQNKQCKQILITKEQYTRLINYIQGSFQKDAKGAFIPISTDAVYGMKDAFYEANGSYSLFKTCNTWANDGLKSCGQKCCFWTAFDTGIFKKYE